MSEITDRPTSGRGIAGSVSCAMGSAVENPKNTAWSHPGNKVAFAKCQSVSHPRRSHHYSRPAEFACSHVWHLSFGVNYLGPPAVRL